MELLLLTFQQLFLTSNPLLDIEKGGFVSLLGGFHFYVFFPHSRRNSGRADGLAPSDVGPVSARRRRGSLKNSSHSYFMDRYSYHMDRIEMVEDISTCKIQRYVKAAPAVSSVAPAVRSFGQRSAASSLTGRLKQYRQWLRSSIDQVGGCGSSC